MRQLEHFRGRIPIFIIAEQHFPSCLAATYEQNQSITAVCRHFANERELEFNRCNEPLGTNLLA